MGRLFSYRIYFVAIIRFYQKVIMVVLDSITVKWVQLIGGSDTIYNILALMFVFTILFVFYKIGT